MRRKARHEVPHFYPVRRKRFSGREEGFSLINHASGLGDDPQLSSTSGFDINYSRRDNIICDI